MSSNNKFMCGVPQSSCTGGVLKSSQGIRGLRAHGSSEEAFKCKARHLIASGYTRVGQREFQAPNNGAIEVLTKKIRYGGRLRRGKSEPQKGTTASRHMPHTRTGGLVIG